MATVSTAKGTLQRARQVGNSLVVTIPKELAEARGITAGTFVQFDPLPCDLIPRVDPEFAAILDEIGPRSEEALKYLKEH
jgi:antitoxin component of MazEF toxin-antitoxin module